jgi:hypothetical protein
LDGPNGRLHRGILAKSENQPGSEIHALAALQGQRRNAAHLIAV